VATVAAPAFTKLELLEFLNPALRLGVDRVLFTGEAHLRNQPAVLSCGTRPAEQVAPDCFLGRQVQWRTGDRRCNLHAMWTGGFAGRRVFQQPLKARKAFS